LEPCPGGWVISFARGIRRAPVMRRLPPSLVLLPKLLPEPVFVPSRNCGRILHLPGSGESPKKIDVHDFGLVASLVR
jgi:hypothetical protein